MAFKKVDLDNSGTLTYDEYKNLNITVPSDLKDWTARSASRDEIRKRSEEHKAWVVDMNDKLEAEKSKLNDLSSETETTEEVQKTKEDL